MSAPSRHGASSAQPPSSSSSHFELSSVERWRSPGSGRKTAALPQPCPQLAGADSRRCICEVTCILGAHATPLEWKGNWKLEEEEERALGCFCVALVGLAVAFFFVAGSLFSDGE